MEGLVFLVLYLWIIGVIFLVNRLIFMVIILGIMT